MIDLRIIKKHFLMSSIHKIFVCFLGLMCVVFLVQYFLYYRKNTTVYDSVFSDLTEIKKTYSMLQKMNSNYIELKEVESFIEVDFGKIAVPLKSSSIGKEISESLANSELVILEETYSPIKRKSGIAEVSIKLHFEGDYQAIRKVIGKLSNIAYLVVIEDLELKKSASGVQAKIQLKVLSRVEDA